MTITQQKIYNEIKDYLIITLALAIYSVSWTQLLLPYKIVTGGVTGIAAIIYYATDIPINLSYFVINAVLLVVALFVLGWRFMIKTIYAIGVLFGMLTVALWFQPDHPLLGEGQELMAIIVGCTITGISLAMVFLSNGSTGGTDIIAACFNKFYDISLGQVLLLVDICIIASSWPILQDPRKMIFGFVTMAIECFVLDLIMNKRRESVQFFIFSKKYQEIANSIAFEVKRGVTILDGHGWYSGQPVKVIWVMCKRYESQNIFRLVKMLDPNAFVSQSAVRGLYGEGFDQIKIKIDKNKNNDTIGGNVPELNANSAESTQNLNLNIEEKVAQADLRESME